MVIATASPDKFPKAVTKVVMIILMMMMILVMIMIMLILVMVIVRDDIFLRINFFKQALPVKLRPPSPKRARWSFFGGQTRHLSVYYRIWFKLIMIMKIMNIKMISNGDNIDDYGNENDQKPADYHGFTV